jgi:hypothetical protein
MAGRFIEFWCVSRYWIARSGTGFFLRGHGCCAD